MRIVLITLLLLIMSTLAGTGFADEKSDCLNKCANDKRSNDMYCPPAGGFSDEENKQCVTKNTTEYNSCIMTCSPSPPADQQSTTTPPPSMPLDEPVTTDK